MDDDDEIVPPPPYRGIDWIDTLEQSRDARLLLAEGQADVERWILHRAAVRDLDLHVILKFHEILFHRIWPDFAGKLRGPDPGQIAINVEFGYHRGSRYEDVPEEMAALSGRIIDYLRQLDEFQVTMSEPFLHNQVCRVASYVHCKLIQIHPFVNGNGRTARVCLNYLAVRYGYLPIPIERPKGEYTDAINTYLNRRIYDHFADFLAPLMKRE